MGFEYQSPPPPYFRMAISCDERPDVIKSVKKIIKEVSVALIVRLTYNSKVRFMGKNILISVVLFFSFFLAVFFSYKTSNSVVNGIEDSKAIVVLELFTSQGCSSCPPADRLLDEVKGKFPEEVFALSYHVDYWNYIGWTDPFSQSKFSTKQEFYNRKLKSRSNYTPQVVVNGNSHFVGSNRANMYEAIEGQKLKNAPNKIEMADVKIADEKVLFNYKLLGNSQNKQLRAVLVIEERITKVSRGENRNRTLKNTNIVVAEKYLPIGSDMLKGTVNIPPLVSKNDVLSLMLISETENMSVTGAAKKALP